MRAKYEVLRRETIDALVVFQMPHEAAALQDGIAFSARIWDGARETLRQRPDGILPLTRFRLLVAAARLSMAERHLGTDNGEDERHLDAVRRILDKVVKTNFFPWRSPSDMYFDTDLFEAVASPPDVIYVQF